MNIGRVKVDINKTERDFEQLTLSDINVVKYLIRFRDKIDIYYDNQNDNYYQHAGNIQELNQELISLYVSLDDTIEKCKLLEEEKALIKLVGLGFTFGAIADYFDRINGEQVKRKFNAICKKIVNKNNELWTINIVFNYIKSEWKNCSKCENILPMNERFFRKQDTCRDGFRPECRQCEVNSKK